eukprot:TRINITY_DN6507_c1_g2_i1.p1 TRINITY_DN6507_c1_g2~~TRINITY_DN6507_c1_g2_i1.p1  ORF type:complete len:791 (+),score=249.86 TRINITY_DN6507_c1_g2_i1:349-2373(+)
MAAAASAAGGKRAEEVVRRKAAAMANELATAVSPTAISTALPLAELMFNRVYNGLIFVQEQLAALVKVFEETGQQGKSLILMPSHKSHVDYIVLQFLFCRLGLSAPAIAAGDNLNLPGVGSFLRRVGAFFIRRTFDGSDGELYTAVVADYLEALLRRGVNIKFFPEGGRSRSGKLLQPKIGMLGMLIEPILAGRVDDAVIVPISVYYDKVMEAGSYVHELLGAKKKKESVLGVLESAKSLFAINSLGSVQVRIAEPFSVREYLQQQFTLKRAAGVPFKPEANRRDMQKLLISLAYHTLDQVNAVSSITPTALVGTVLLTTRGRGVGRRELILRVHWLRRELLRSGGRVPYFLSERTGEVVDSALAVLGDLVYQEPGLLEPVYSVAKHFELSYYRNMVVHVFIEQAIMAVAIHRHLVHQPEKATLRRKELMPSAKFLSGLLKLEFVFSGAAGRTRFSGRDRPAPAEGAAGAGQPDESMTTLMRNFEAAAEVMVQAGALQPSSDPEVLNVEQLHQAKRVGGYELWSAHFTFLCMLIWPLVESYWLVLAGLHAVFSRGADIIPEAVFITRLQSFAKTLYHLGNLQFHESVSQESLKRALQTYHVMRVVRRSRLESEKTSTVLLQLGAEYQGAEGVRKLSDLCEKVASFRRRGRDQKYLENYPDYLAQLAFGQVKARM